MNTHPTARQRLETALSERFGSEFAVDPDVPGLEELTRMSEHRSHRKFSARVVSPELLRLLLACAFSAPSKSDLQQADVVQVANRKNIEAIANLIHDMPWIANAPVFLVFCGNNRRLRQAGEWHGKPFVNDHLDHFMNAAVDAAIVMATFIRAAEAAGLATCPISHVRNHLREINEMLALPDCVFPVAGMCVGYPAEAGRISARLPLEVTVHADRFDESDIRGKIDAYDRRRHALQPYRRQRHAERYADSAFYGWSEDKARQYSVPDREDFGAYIRGKGFSLK
jgi:FMN reductase [NAD(P)H]